MNEEIDCHRKGFTQITEENLAQRSREWVAQLKTRLCELQEVHEQICDVRVVGLLCGMELVQNRETKRPAGTLVQALSEEYLRRGLSIDVARGRPDAVANCFRIAPPLTVNTEEIDLAIEIFDRSLRSVLAPRV